MSPFEWREYHGGFAIDFGDSTIKMAYYDNDGSHLIKLNLDGNSLPASLCFGMNGKTSFGTFNYEIVMDHFKTKLNQQNLNLIVIDSVTDLMSQLIKYCVDIAQNQMQNRIKIAVVGQSPYLRRREYWKDPFKKAGISVERTIQDPIAACLNFQSCTGLTRKLKGNILVIDWGHELKITKIEEEESIFEILENYGDNSLGGYSITMDMAKYCFEKLNKPFEETNQHMKKIFYACENAKKLLSTGLNDCNIQIMDQLVSFNRDELCNIYKEKISHIPKILKKMKVHSVDQLILCGGSLYSGYLKDNIKILFDENTNILTSSEPDEIIVRGIAQQASYLHSPRLNNCLVSYTLPLSIGVGNDSGKMLSIVPRNTWYAVSKEAELTRTVVNGEIILNFFEGEYENVVDNVWLGKISFTDLEDGSIVLISIILKVDNDCNINVNARINNDIRHIVLTKYNRTLSKSETSKMIDESYYLGTSLPTIYKTFYHPVLDFETQPKGKPHFKFNLTVEDVD